MPTKDLRNLVDTYVSAMSKKEKAKNYRGVSRIYVQGNEGNGATYPYRVFMTWANPVPIRNRVVSYKLGLYVGEDWGNGNSIYIQAINKQWSDSKITWNNMPGVTGPQVTYTLSALKAKNGYIEIDISPIMAAVAAGTIAWRGIRILCTGTRKSFHSTQAKASLRPIIRAVWSNEPVPPTNLVPRGASAVSTNLPLLDFTYTDPTNGNRDQIALQVQVATNAAFTAMTLDTGEVASTLSQYQLTNTPLEAGTMYYWRARVKTETGVWTAFSNVESFYYSPLPSLTIINPTNTGFVEDTTPLISWQLSGTQSQFSLQIYKEADGYRRPVYDTGVITSAEEDFTLPSGIVTNAEDNYLVWVSATDNVTRMSVAGASRFAVASRYFKFQSNGTITPVANLQFTPDPTLPFETLTWTRDQAPDSFAIVQNGAYFPDVDPLILQDQNNPTQYRAIVLSPGRRDVTYSVRPKVNGVVGDGPSVTLYRRRLLSWLIGRDRNYPCAFHNASWDISYREVSSIVDALEGAPAIVLQTMRGRVGTFSGEVIDNELPLPYTGRAMKNSLTTIREQRGGVAQLVFADEVINVIIYDLKINPKPKAAAGATDYVVSFSWIEDLG